MEPHFISRTQPHVYGTGILFEEPNDEATVTSEHTHKAERTKKTEEAASIGD